MELNFDAETFSNWPEFHNGCASGLRVFMKDNDPNTKSCTSIGKTNISRNWIAFNRPNDPTFEHAGFVMAMGLLSHIKECSIPDIYQYLTRPRHEASGIATLLSVGIANRGSKNKRFWEILSLHIPSMVPGGFNDLEISSITQASALLACGFLYLGSSDTFVSQVLINEIGRRVQGDACEDRECYSLCAGFGLGLVNLGKGTLLSGHPDLDLDNRLATYINGGRDWINAGRNFSLQEIGMTNSENVQSSRIKEGTMVNIGVTSPGATMALALMF
eukprot:UN26625